MDTPYQSNCYHCDSEITLLLKALRFAAEKHRDQRRKDREASPYINHPIQVAEVLWQIGGVRDMVTIIGALLHDTVEDTNTTAEEIQQLFGAEVATLVMEVTDDKTLSKVQRKRLQIEHAAHKSTRAKQLKLADKICNVYDISHSPPQYWSFIRRKDYLDWSEQVIQGVRGVNCNLESYYDGLLQTARQKLFAEQETAVTFAVGDRIRHPHKPEWGIGQIIECTSDQQLRLFFVNAGQKYLKLDKTTLIRLNSEEAAHPILDNLKPITERQAACYKSLSELVETFLSTYPEGFYAETYFTKYRHPHLQVCQIARERLNQTLFTQLLDEQNYKEISQRVLEILHKTTLIDTAEILALEHGLQSETAQQHFAQTLYNLLFEHETITEQNFNNFVACLGSLNAAYWSLVTYFLFITYPFTHILLNPAITLAAADLCAFKLEYDQQPNWNTYQHLLSFANYFKSNLTDMQPRDMFDIYTFMAGILL